VDGGTITATTSTSFVDTAASVTFATAAAIGDKIHVTYAFMFDVAANSGTFRIVVVDGASTIELAETRRGVPIGGGVTALRIRVDGVALYTVATGGTFTVKAQILAGVTTATLYGAGSIVAQMIRP